MFARPRLRAITRRTLPRDASPADLLFLRTAALLASATFVAAEVEHRAGEHADREHPEIDQRSRFVDRLLVRRARDGEAEVDLLRVVHADVEHDKKNAEQEKGFDDGF